LRFIKVKDDNRLNAVLEKILASLLLIFNEKDLANAASLDHNDKLKELEELMTLISNRITNSKGTVKVPVNQILTILGTE
jgi:hypothetical protein